MALGLHLPGRRERNVLKHRKSWLAEEKCRLKQQVRRANLDNLREQKPIQAQLECVF
jgi:hypothetical protein